MVRLSVFILIGLMLFSCSGTKETRRSNRAAKKLDRLTSKYPELLKPDTSYIAVTMRTPIIQNRIVDRLTPVFNTNPDFNTPTQIQEPNQGNVLPGQISYLEGSFKDDTLTANVIVYPDGTIDMEYRIKRLEVDTLIQDIDETIQPVKYRPLPLPWWKIALMWLGGAFIVVVLFRVVTTSRG